MKDTIFIILGVFGLALIIAAPTISYKHGYQAGCEKGSNKLANVLGLQIGDQSILKEFCEKVYEGKI